VLILPSDFQSDVLSLRALDPLERNKVIIERTKLAIDTVKHISTLATGSIVAITAIVEKAPKPTTMPYLLMAAVVSMMLCILLCAIYLFLLGVPSRWDEAVLRTSSMRAAMQVAAVILYLAFASGLLMLGCFVLSQV
jgi:hypothetical protein